MDVEPPTIASHAFAIRPALLTLTIGGTTIATSCWLGWDVAALLAAEAATGIGLAVAVGEPDDDISSI
ncbi:hypothetical protein [Dactylosporangium sp. CA-139066]|uniref:hypothetical protein n=1 Tax=Dactylosporangium sp. CA-139066 TaxID=3239930 RepID=UPI003D93D71F